MRLEVPPSTGRDLSLFGRADTAVCVMHSGSCLVDMELALAGKGKGKNVNFS